MVTINSCDFGTGTSAQVLTSNGTGVAPTFQNNAASVTWSDQSGSFAAAATNGYFITATSTATLPAAPTNGSMISFIVNTTSLLTITANTGQFIRLGTSLSASAGTCVSSNQGDSISLVYRSTGTTWFVLNSPTGAWTIT